MGNFQEEYERFMQFHLNAREGERLRRLEEGYGHAEKLFLQNCWWPAIGDFKNLHPEYEVSDFRDGKRFLDFAYIHPMFRICFEIDGYGPHWREVNRWKFADHLMRQNYLVIDGWKVIRFSYDDIAEKPRRCQQLIQQLMGRWLIDQDQGMKLSLLEKEVVRLAMTLAAPFTPSEASEQLGMHIKTTGALLRAMAVKGLIQPAGGTQRIRTYQLSEKGEKSLFSTNIKG